jgi:hypothetical protein
MKPSTRALATALAAALAASLLLPGCQDRHQPTRPTVAASAMR